MIRMRASEGMGDFGPLGEYSGKQRRALDETEDQATTVMPYSKKQIT